MWNLIKYEERIAVIDEFGTELTYGGLEIETQKLARIIGRRCMVFSLCKNEIGSFLGYVAFLNNRVVPLMLNANLEKELLYDLMERYCPSYVWIPDNQKEEFSNMQLMYSAYGYSLLKTGYNKEYPLNDALCDLLTTSGSTGSPNFVRQSYQNVLENARSIAEYLELDETERPITTLPMNYCYGLSIINSHLLVGATILVTDKGLMQKEFWSFFKSQEATSFGGVPYTYEMLDKLRFFRMELPSLRYCTQAGGKLTPELHKKFAEHAKQVGTKFIVMYGQCEATARMAYLPAEKSVEKYGSMGIAIPRGRFYLIDADGSVITKPHITGELVYEGPNVTLGYAECGEDLIKGDERGGVLHTGDMAEVDEDGFYYITGRKKRFLKIYGNRVNLDAVDRMIKAEFNNIECASSGVDDHMYIFIVEAGIRLAVKDFVTQKTRLNPAAFEVVVIDEIPKNDAGKTRYKELVKYYEHEA